MYKINLIFVNNLSNTFCHTNNLNLLRNTEKYYTFNEINKQYYEFKSNIFLSLILNVPKE